MTIHNVIFILIRFKNVYYFIITLEFQNNTYYIFPCNIRQLSIYAVKKKIKNNYILFCVFRVKNWALKFGVDLWAYGRQLTRMNELQRVRALKERSTINKIQEARSNSHLRKFKLCATPYFSPIG